MLAKWLGGFSLADNQPADIIVFNGKVKEFKAGAKLTDQQFDFLSKKYGIKHAAELKTMVSNKANKLTMKRSAMDKKRSFERKHKTRLDTIVFDDHKVFNAKGSGKHDPTKRVIRFRAGYGSFRVQKMHEVRSSKELTSLLATKRQQLPEGAK